MTDNILKDLLTDNAMHVARHLVTAWEQNIIEQIFRIRVRRFTKDDANTYYTKLDYTVGVDKSAEIVPDMDLGALRELSINGLILLTEEGRYGDHDGLMAEITLLKPLQTAVKKNFG